MKPKTKCPKRGPTYKGDGTIIEGTEGRGTLKIRKPDCKKAIRGDGESEGARRQRILTLALETDNDYMISQVSIAVQKYLKRKQEGLECGTI